MATAIAYMVVFAIYLAVGVAEQVSVMRQISSMAKTLREAGYDA